MAPNKRPNGNKETIHDPSSSVIGISESSRVKRARKGDVQPIVSPILIAIRATVRQVAHCGHTRRKASIDFSFMDAMSEIKRKNTSDGSPPHRFVTAADSFF